LRFSGFNFLATLTDKRQINNGATYRLHSEVGLVLHLWQHVLVEVYKLTVSCLHILLKEGAKVIETLLVSFLVLAVGGAVLLNRIIS
jgi:hypothetical protein